MCKFCEKYIKDGKPHNQEPIFDCPELGEMACIIESTPISRRKHEDDGLVACIVIATPLEDFQIPIKYCPICGKQIE